MKKKNENYRNLLERYTAFDKELSEVEKTCTNEAINAELESKLAIIVAELAEWAPEKDDGNEMNNKVQELQKMNGEIILLRGQLREKDQENRELKRKLDEVSDQATSSEAKNTKLEHERTKLEQERDKLQEETSLYSELQHAVITEYIAYYSKQKEARSDVKQRMEECVGTQSGASVICQICKRDNRLLMKKRIFSRTAAMDHKDNWYKHFGMYHVAKCPFCDKAGECDSNGLNRHFRDGLCIDRLQGIDKWYWENRP